MFYFVGGKRRYESTRIRQHTAWAKRICLAQPTFGTGRDEAEEAGVSTS